MRKLKQDGSEHDLDGAAPSFWGSLTDQQLLEKDFDTIDPTEVIGIVQELPRDRGLPTLEAQYDTKLTTGLKVRCVHCKYENHYKGFAFRYESGAATLVGIDCGEKLYGVHFSKQQYEFNQARERAKNLRRRARVQGSWESLRAELQSLIDHQAVEIFRSTRSAFLKAVPELAKWALNACHKSNGEMYVEERIRDVLAESKRDERLEAMGQRLDSLTKAQRTQYRKEATNPHPIFKLVPKFLGRIEGQAFFRTDLPWPHEELIRLRELSNVLILRLSVENRTYRLRQLLGELDHVIEEIVFQIKVLDSLPDAFGTANLFRLAEWANRTTNMGGSYEAAGSRLTWTPPKWSTKRESPSIEFPSGYATPEATKIAAFKRLFG
jgi:hypothetical protein